MSRNTSTSPEQRHDRARAAGVTVTDVAETIYTQSELSRRNAGYFVGASISAYCPQYKRLITGWNDCLRELGA